MKRSRSGGSGFARETARLWRVLDFSAASPCASTPTAVRSCVEVEGLVKWVTSGWNFLKELWIFLY
jgi:hypothetical protein